MSRYRRAKVEGGVFFFTVALADRSSDLLVRHVDRLRKIYRFVQERYPFETIAVCILPDHLHAVWSLPEGDSNFPLRWSLIKSGFSRELAGVARRSASKIAKRDKGIWQRRYWEHAIRDDVDLARHVDYVHFNPVKHGYTARVCDWPYSSFDRYVARGLLTPGCSRHRRCLRRMICRRSRQALARGQMREAACPRPSARRAHLPTLRRCL
jgi:putative transposase